MAIKNWHWGKVFLCWLPALVFLLLFYVFVNNRNLENEPLIPAFFFLFLGFSIFAFVVTWNWFGSEATRAGIRDWHGGKIVLSWILVPVGLTFAFLFRDINWRPTDEAGTALLVTALCLLLIAPSLFAFVATWKWVGSKDAPDRSIAYDE